MTSPSRGYPYETRLITELFETGYLPNVASIAVEPQYGLGIRMLYKDGTVRMVHEADLGLNHGSANQIARDKVCTRHFLALGGFSIPKGKSFMLDWWADEMKVDSEDSSRVRNAVGYIHTNLDYPVYVKPHDGACGLNIWKCFSDSEIQDVLGQYEHRRIRVALIEATVSMPDYRVVVLDGRIISAYRRDPAQVVGDGVSTVAQLRDRLAKESAERDEDVHVESYIPQMDARLARIGIDNQHVLRPHEMVQLIDLSNLCAGGTALDLTDQVHSRWATLAVDIATYLNLRLAGIDMACLDLTSGAGEYAILEVNGTPGLDLYGAAGVTQEEIVRNLYAQVFNTMPAY